MLLLVYIGEVWFPEIQKMTMIFRDPTKPLADDGSYGALMGILIGVTFALPMLLPLLLVAWIHVKLGVVCPQCGASLTLWRRPIQIEKNGTCCKCHAVIFVPK